MPIQPDIEDTARPAVPSGDLVCTDDLCEAGQALPGYARRARLHKLAEERGLEGYVDPLTAETVPTAAFLQRRECCGDKCRHCPYNYVNVVKAKDSESSSDSDSDSYM